MEKADSGQKLYTSMRLLEFPDQYVIEPTDGSSSSSLAVSRKDGSMKLIDEIPEYSSLRVPKIVTIFGVVGMLRLLAGSYLLLIIEREGFGSFLGHPIFKISSMKIFPCNHSLEHTPAEQKRTEIEFSSLLNIAERTSVPSDCMTWVMSLDCFLFVDRQSPDSYGTIMCLKRSSITMWAYG